MAENEDDEAAQQLGGCGWLQLLTTVCGDAKNLHVLFVQVEQKTYLIYPPEV